MPDRRKYQYRKKPIERIDQVAVPELNEHEIGNRIKGCRGNRGWTGRDLSDATGISHSTIMKLEAGHRVPTLHQLVALGAALKLSLDEIAFGCESRTKALDKVESNIAQQR